MSKFNDMSFGTLYCRMEDCKINEKTKINKPYAFHKVTLRYGTAVSKNASVSYSTIGKFCSIGPNLVCGWGIHPLNGISINAAFYSTKMQNGFTFSKTDKIEERKPIFIGNDVFIGANVTILDGVTIGDGAVIGAGAVVSKDIPPYAIAMGCPIQVIRYRFNPEIIERLLVAKWWDQDESTFKKVEAQFLNVTEFLNEIEHSIVKP